MKKLTLKDAMHGLQVTLKDGGYELRSIAGSACYDAWGVRTTVNGIPEYFPLSISVDDQRSKPEDENGVFSIKAGQVFIKDTAGITRVKVCGMNLGVNTDSEAKKEARLVEMVSPAVSDRIRKELQPGGLLHNR